MDAVVVAFADKLLINVQAVLSAFVQRPVGTELLQPSVQGLPDNLVVFSGTLMALILACYDQMGVQTWQRDRPAASYHLETPHGHYHLDMGNEEVRLAMTLLTGQSLRWPYDLEH